MRARKRRGQRKVPPRESAWALGLEVRHLRAFVTLVDRGSMTAAAEVLGVAQSTVSEALAALERALGTRVVERQRGAHGIGLTPAGGALLPHARSVLASLEDAHLAVATVAPDVRASVEVIANESVSTYLLPHALGELRQRWPNMRFAVTVGTCQSITEGIEAGRFDIGLMLQTGGPASAEASAGPPRWRLSDVPLVVFCGKAHPLAAQATAAPVPRDRLAPYTLFVSDARGYFYEFIRDFFRGDGLPGPRLEPTGSVEAVKRSVVATGLALGVLPAYALGEELRAGAVHALPVRPAAPPLRLEAMLYRTRSPIHPAVAELMEVLRTSRDQRTARRHPSPADRMTP
jgi:DNA-binding transcriptional LysR family regulator